jgi:hypothetical protein
MTTGERKKFYKQRGHRGKWGRGKEGKAIYKREGRGHSGPRNGSSLPSREGEQTINTTQFGLKDNFKAVQDKVQHAQRDHEYYTQAPPAQEGEEGEEDAHDTDRADEVEEFADGVARTLDLLGQSNAPKSPDGDSSGLPKQCARVVRGVARDEHRGGATL